MAYVNLLVVVTPEQVAALRSDGRQLLRPSRVAAVSYLISMRGWVDAQPLQSLLSRALDGGEVLAASLWHPLRNPVYHNPENVRDIAAPLSEAWDRFLVEYSLPEDDWYRYEIGKAVALFRYAVDQGEGVVSILQPPADAQRARQVVIPLEPLFISRVGW
jgi:hypothetical protein